MHCFSCWSRWWYNPCIYATAWKAPGIFKYKYGGTFRGVGYTWSAVANALLISRTTLWRKLREVGITVHRNTDIIDDAFDDQVRILQHNDPHCGQVFLHSMLKALGTHVQRHRLRQSVQGVDPESSHSMMETVDT